MVPDPGGSDLEAALSHGDVYRLPPILKTAGRESFICVVCFGFFDQMTLNILEKCIYILGQTLLGAKSSKDIGVAACVCALICFSSAGSQSRILLVPAVFNPPLST